MSPIARLVGWRVLVALGTLLFVSVAVFVATTMLPGDVAEVVLGQSATPEAVAGLRAAMHLDQPAPIRYLIWLRDLLSGNPGKSLVNSLPVADMIGSRLPNSLVLAALSTAFSVPLGLGLGIASGGPAGLDLRPFGQRRDALDHLGARVLHRDRGGPDLRRAVALAPGPLKPADRVARGLRLGLHAARRVAVLHRHRPDDADDPGRAHRRAPPALLRDGAAEGARAGRASCCGTRCRTRSARWRTPSRSACRTSSAARS